LAGRIDFFSVIGPRCPICSARHCYRAITPYWRHAIELFPEFTKHHIPIARFLCRKKKRTFSLLPVQLIPYCQYTVAAVIGTLQLGLQCWQVGQQGFWGAALAVDEVDPDSLVTPWLVACWLAMVLRGLRRGHAVLRRFFDLSGITTCKGWPETAGYFLAFGGRPQEVASRYSRATGQFLFGAPSQQRMGR
jgi:hypothetical protein